MGQKELDAELNGKDRLQRINRGSAPKGSPEKRDYFWSRFVGSCGISHKSINKAVSQNV